MTAQEINTSMPRPRAIDEVSGADLDEPTKTEILADIKIGLQQALAGEGRPAREALADIRRKTARDTDLS